MPSHGDGDDPWVEIIWTPTLRDTRELYATMVPWRGRVLAVVAGIVMLLAVVATVPLTTTTEDETVINLIVLLPASLVVAYLAFVAALPHFIGALMWQLQPSLRSTETLRIDGVAVTSTTPRKTVTIPWQEVRRVRDHDQLVVLFTGRGRRALAVPIPLRVLPPDQRTTVRTLIADRGSRPARLPS
ncbi:YcxB family protein [Isoptericola croceus]|uniref:YcxB family protein n=1 Tax=Isoptericola croceus TaxID=3031406 RepID=UPI0023F8E0A8|nr:YcxB family protein [Isoptericola croceus]